MKNGQGAIKKKTIYVKKTFVGEIMLKQIDVKMFLVMKRVLLRRFWFSLLSEKVNRG
jgi:hypothetical protein